MSKKIILLFSFFATLPLCSKNVSDISDPLIDRIYSETSITRSIKLLSGLIDPRVTLPQDQKIYMTDELIGTIAQYNLLSSRTRAPKTNNERLLEMIRFNNRTQVRSLLVSGADPNTSTSHGESALGLAARFGYSEIIAILVEFGANVNGLHQENPLIKAAHAGHPKTVILLINYGVEVDSIDVHKRTALMCAAERGHLQVVQALLDHGAQIEHTDALGNTPLMCAASQGHLDLVNFFIQRGANLTARNKFGETALDLSKKHENHRYI